MNERERYEQETRELLRDERVRRVTDEIGHGLDEPWRHYHVLGDPSTTAARGATIEGTRLG